MSIYARTEAGQSIAYDARSDLALPMRSLLKLIDGKTEAQTYVVSLSAFGDVPAMFAALLRAGYIQEIVESEAPAREALRGDAFADSIRNAKGSKFNPSRWFSSSKPEMSLQDAWDPTEIAQRSTFNTAQISAHDAEVNFEPASSQASPQDHRWAATHHAGVHDRLMEHESSQHSQAQVKLVTESMATFLLTQMPDRAFGLLSEIESIATWQDLRALLDGYSAIISPLGLSAAEHLTYIRQNLVYNLHESA